MICACPKVRCWLGGHHWHFKSAQPYYYAMEYTDQCCRCGKTKSEIVVEH